MPSPPPPRRYGQHAWDAAAALPPAATDPPDGDDGDDGPAAQQLVDGSVGLVVVAASWLLAGTAAQVVTGLAVLAVAVMASRPAQTLQAPLVVLVAVGRTGRLLATRLGGADPSGRGPAGGQ